MCQLIIHHVDIMIKCNVKLACFTMCSSSHKTQLYRQQLMLTLNCPLLLIIILLEATVAVLCGLCAH